MNDSKQILYAQCTAKWPGGLQCSVPVFDVIHERPLCDEHARKKVINCTVLFSRTFFDHSVQKVILSKKFQVKMFCCQGLRGSDSNCVPSSCEGLRDISFLDVCIAPAVSTAVLLHIVVCFALQSMHSEQLGL